MKEVMEFKTNGKMDLMGFKWYKVYRNGIPVTHKGVQVEFNAVSVRHCFDMWNQTKRANIKLGTTFPDSITS